MWETMEKISNQIDSQFRIKWNYRSFSFRQHKTSMKVNIDELKARNKHSKEEEEVEEVESNWIEKGSILCASETVLAQRVI